MNQVSEQAANSEISAWNQADEDAPAESPTSTRRWAVRGVVLGGLAGATAGAGMGAVFARRPETRRALKDAVDRNGRHLAKAAAVAIGDVLASKSLKQLIASNGDADRRQLMTETAKEAAAAAAQATRDTLVSLRPEREADAA
jgi:hypothetical protein